MKKQILTGLLAVTTSASAFAAPFFMGNVKTKDELIIFNDSIVCSAYALPVGETDPKKIVYAEYTGGFEIEGGFDLTGRIVGNSFNVHYDAKSEIVHISIQEQADVTKVQMPSYSASSSGTFTPKHKVASLDMIINGKNMSVGCSKQDAPVSAK